MVAIEKIKGTKNGYLVHTGFPEKLINEEYQGIIKQYEKVNCVIINPKASFHFSFRYGLLFTATSRMTFNKKVPVNGFFINGRF